jgi:coenzyme F420-dependent glucose-6-phosphate dehydrogenase
MTQIYWFLGHEQFQPEELVKQAKLVEDMGFDGVMVSEHLQPWVDDNGAAGFAFSTLGAIAATTNKIKLLTGVTTPLFRYHPAVVAQAAATIDRLSNGRFELGIGTGENLNEGPLGYEFPDYKGRSDRIKEAIEIMEKLLNGERVTFDGVHYQTKELKLYSPPINKVPILMAAGGPMSSKTAARYCEGIITSVKDESETIANIIEPAKSIRENFRLVASRWSIFAESDDDAWQALSAWRGLRAPSRATSTNPLELQNEADKLNHEEVISKYSRIKTISDYVSVYSPLITKLKADTIVIQTTSLDQLGTISAVGSEVLPQLRKL